MLDNISLHVFIWCFIEDLYKVGSLNEVIIEIWKQNKYFILE